MKKLEWIFTIIGLFSVILCLSEWTTIGIFLLIFFIGYFSLRRLLSGTSTNTKKNVKKISEGLFWYSGCFIMMTALALIFGASTLTDMYEDWSVYNRSIHGFIRIFAPIIAIIVGSVLLAYISSSKEWSIKLVKICLFIVILALFFYRPIQSTDGYASARKHKFADKKDAETLSIKKNRGVFAKSLVDGRYSYELEDGLFKKNKPLMKNQEYCIFRRDVIKKRGPYDMIQIWWPDKDGELSNESRKYWVRIDNFDFATHYKDKEGKKEESKEKKDEKKQKVSTVTISDYGQYRFNLQKGERTNWITFSLSGLFNYSVIPVKGAKFNTHYSNGDVYRNSDGNVSLSFPKLYLEGVSENAEIILKVEKHT